MPRDKYHPYMVPYSLTRRMAETGHTTASVRDFLQPYDISAASVARWAKGGQVPFQLKAMIEEGLNRIAPPPTKWVPYELGRERTARRMSRRTLSTFIGAHPGTIEDWESRGMVPGKKFEEIRKLFAGILPNPRKRN